MIIGFIGLEARESNTDIKKAEHLSADGGQ